MARAVSSPKGFFDLNSFAITKDGLSLVDIIFSIFVSTDSVLILYNLDIESPNLVSISVVSFFNNHFANFGHGLVAGFTNLCRSVPLKNENGCWAFL